MQMVTTGIPIVHGNLLASSLMLANTVGSNSRCHGDAYHQAKCSLCMSVYECLGKCVIKKGKRADELKG